MRQPDTREGATVLLRIATPARSGIGPFAGE
jgi:hypothetical protein